MVGTARVVLDCTGPSHDIGVAVAEVGLHHLLSIVGPPAA